MTTAASAASETVCKITANSIQEAKEKAHMIEDEEIERTEIENTGYVVWDDPREILQ